MLGHSAVVVCLQSVLDVGGPQALSKAALHFYLSLRLLFVGGCLQYYHSTCLFMSERVLCLFVFTTILPWPRPVFNVDH